jgi:hypothetical protein
MSNQIVISSGAKVRELEGVLTGTSGIVNALGINVPSGIPQLDGSGKILVSQLPNSVMEYKGSWNAATNTPTLVNGTGNAGDVYLCEVAGTVNFGAGPITFAVGDQVIYSGSIWQRASGATGTVTSVAVTESGDALTITGSPITTSGTINIGFAGTSGQYVNGAGGLTTFPSLTGFVPYTGATAALDMGNNSITTSNFIFGKAIELDAGVEEVGGRVIFRQRAATSGGGANYTTFGAQSNNNVNFSFWQDAPSGINRYKFFTFSVDNLTLNVNRTYQMPDASGTLALTSNLSSYVPYTGATADVNLGVNFLIANAAKFDGSGSFGGHIALKQNGTAAAYTGYATLSSIGVNKLNIYYGEAAAYATELDNSLLTQSRLYKFPDLSGTLALLEGSQTFSGSKIFSNSAKFTSLVFVDRQINISKTPSLVAYTGGYITNYGTTSGIIYADGDTSNLSTLNFNFGGNYTYTFPAATGTLALTSDIPSVSGTATYIPVFTGANSLGNSQIWNNAGIIGMGTNYSSPAFSVVASSGDTLTQGKLAINTTSFSGTSVLQVNGAATITGGLTGTSASFTTSGGSDTFAINHSSGSGIALNITKGGNGEGLYINKTSGSGNAATIIGTLNATTLVKSGGTSSQYLMADGSTSTLTNPVTGTGTTNYLPKFTGANTIGNSNLINDASGNLGLGVTPSAWSAGKAFEIGQLGNSVWGEGNGDIWILANSYYNAGFKYANSIAAGGYNISKNIHKWYSAPSGTAGNAITFTQAMTLDASGRLGIGNTTMSSFDSYGNQLVVGNGSTNQGITIYASTSTESSLYFADGTGAASYRGYIYYRHSNDSMTFGTSAATALTLASTGAATFSSTLQSNDLTIKNSANAETLDLFLSPSTSNGFIDYPSGRSLMLRNKGSLGGLTLASTGAATFSSSVKSDGGGSEGKFIIERDSVATNTIVGSLDFTNNNAATTYGKVFGGRNSAGDGYVALGTGISNNLYALESGNVGIGTSSPTQKLDVNGKIRATDDLILAQTNPVIAYDNGSTGALRFASDGGNTERMRITSVGGVGIGTTSVTGTTKLRVINSSAVNGDPLMFVDNAVYNGIGIYSAGADGYNGAATVMILGRNSSTTRSINAGGTINALGTDYAEYMTKAIEDNITKGDIIGVDKNGLLTNIFADSKSFVVKSTNPSFVGGDVWGSVDNIGKLPNDSNDEQKAKHELKLESARVKVDRIAFSGQVPCNVYNAQVGDYIIPIELDGKISGQAVSNPTFEQYQLSVGKVWKIMEDGRAWIAVKIG